MKWVSDPNPVGGWLRERLDDDPAIMTASVVPNGFEAYARVLHPATVRSLPDRPVPELDEWERMPDAEQLRLIDLFDDRPATWRETASAFGSTLEPLIAWPRVVRAPAGSDWSVRLAPDGREFTGPDEGRMPPALLARLSEHLVDATTTPDAGFVAIWEGWGGLLGFLGERSARGFYGFGEDANHQAVLDQSIHDRFNNPYRKPVWQSGILSDEISRGARLDLPGRSHVLFEAAPRAFADPGWILDAPWRDRPAEEHGFEPAAQHPSILWPADRAWVMVSEIDYDSTIVAGSAGLVAAICADEHLEAFEIPAGAEIIWNHGEAEQ